MRLDVFTLVPDAFTWIRERRPLAAVLGSELDLRIFNYRDSTPLSAGQVDDDPYGGGWLIRIRMSDASEADGLLDVDAYKQVLADS